MRIKKFLALLLAAAMALAVFAGCGNNPSIERILMEMLDGRYDNVTVELDPDLKAELHQAISEYGDDGEDAVRGDLEKRLGTNRPLRYLKNLQQGESAFDLLFYLGSNPDAAVQSAYNQWNPIFSTLPHNGQYALELAAIQAEDGYYILAYSKVNRAGSSDRPDRDDPEQEVIPESGYEKDGDKYTIYNDKGLQNVFLGGYDGTPNVDDELDADRANNFTDCTITLKGTTYLVTRQLLEEFNGKLVGEKDTLIKIDGKGYGLAPSEGFEEAALYCGMFGNVLENGSVENLNIEVLNITLGGYAGGYTGSITGINDGNISGCNVTIHTIDQTQALVPWSAGGITGLNRKTIRDCHVTIAAAGSVITDGFGGGIAGINGAKGFNASIEGCSVTIETGGQIISQLVGGIAGLNGEGSMSPTIGANCSVTGSGTIWGKRIDTAFSSIYAGGIVGSNGSDSKVLCGPAQGVTITVTSVDDNTTITAEQEIGNQPGADSMKPYAGTKIGYQDS